VLLSEGCLLWCRRGHRGHDVALLAVLGSREGEQAVWQQQREDAEDFVQLRLMLDRQELVSDVVVGVVIASCRQLQGACMTCR